MAESRFSTLRALWAPTIVKWAVSFVAVVAAYDAFSNQLSLPKLGRLLGMSGTLLPWWGWLLILQAIFVYALFEYVRRIQIPAEPVMAVDPSILRKIEERLTPLETNYAAILRDYQNMRGLEARFTDMLDGLKKAIRSDNDTARSNLAALQERANERHTETEKHLNTIFLAFQALLARESIRQYRETILREGKFLTHGVLNHEPVKGPDWQEWQKHKSTFDSALWHWMEIARRWHPKVEEWVNAMKPDDLTDGRWVGLDDIFEGSNAIITYQTFALRFERWQHFEGNVSSVIHIAAFTGPSAAETLGTMHNGGPTVEGVSP